MDRSVVISWHYPKTPAALRKAFKLWPPLKSQEGEMMETLSQHEFQKLLGIPEWQFDEGYRKAWYLPVVEDGFMRFPAWQLNAHPERLHVVLQQFKWYCGDVRVMHAFMETSHNQLGGRRGREAILDGGVDIAVIAQHAERYACEARARKKAAGEEVGI